MSTKILLDTDIGSDIDDAVCVAYLLAQPRCELLGITTVTGESSRRAMLADILCKVANRHVPIHAGLENPLIIPARQTAAPQYEAAAKWPHHPTFPHGHAVDFLRHTIRAHPGEITLLAIGPLTNIAALLTLDPDIAPLIKSLVLMGGHYLQPPQREDGSVPLEWNILNDPHAAAIVFRAEIPSVRAIGLDVTLQLTMPSSEIRSRFQHHALLRPVLDFAEIWFAEARDTITFHDPLAAAVIFDETLCTYEPGNIEIDLTGAKSLGFTRFKPQPERVRHQVATTVNISKFFEHFFKRFN